ncbi:MAG TPA: non-heme iron oxygenase ferredoxin subunit [Gammaproteobacteria bacterium]|nr:non-heme iron oxygenase ferredoxin subunit [Gammaproteobacteria bacterium]
MAEDWVEVATTEELPPGQYVSVDVDDVQIAVFNCDGELFAIEDVCTHDYNQLTGGEMEGCQIACPRHGAKFDLRSGEAMTPPAYEAVDTFPVKVEYGCIYVRDDRWD